MSSVRQIWTLTIHELRGRWRSLLVWSVILGGLGALYVALFPSMSKFMTEYLERAPESMQGFFGELQGPLTAEIWMGMEFLSLLVPVTLPFMVMLIGARSVAGREERKTLDLLMSNPLPRWRVVASAVLTMAISLAAVLALTWVLTYVAVPIAGVDLSAAHLASALAALWPMCLLFGVLALLLSTLMRRSVLAVVIPSIILLAMYVIETLAQATTSMEPVRVVSLFYHLGNPIEGDFPWTATLLMLAGVCVLSGAAAAVFHRRDLYT